MGVRHSENLAGRRPKDEPDQVRRLLLPHENFGGSQDARLHIPFVVNALDTGEGHPALNRQQG